MRARRPPRRPVSSRSFERPARHRAAGRPGQAGPRASRAGAWRCGPGHRGNRVGGRQRGQRAVELEVGPSSDPPRSQSGGVQQGAKRIRRGSGGRRRARLGRVARAAPASSTPLPAGEAGADGRSGPGPRPRAAASLRQRLLDLPGRRRRRGSSACAAAGRRARSAPRPPPRTRAPGSPRHRQRSRQLERARGSAQPGRGDHLGPHPPGP